MPEIVIVDYRPEWAEEFSGIAAGLRETLNEWAAVTRWQVEHYT